MVTSFHRQGVRYAAELSLQSKSGELLPVRMRSVQTDDVEKIAQLFSTPGIGKKYADGKQYSQEEALPYIKGRVDTWVKRLESNPANPYVCFPVFLMKDGKETDCIAYTTIGYGKDEQGKYYISFGVMEHPNYWNKGYGSEMFRLATQQLLPQLLKDYPTINNQPIDRIYFTSGVDNPAGSKVAMNAGFPPKVNEEGIVQFDLSSYALPKVSYEVPLQKEKLLSLLNKENKLSPDANIGDLLQQYLKENQKRLAGLDSEILRFIDISAQITVTPSDSNPKTATEPDTSQTKWQQRTLREKAADLGLTPTSVTAPPPRAK